MALALAHGIYSAWCSELIELTFPDAVAKVLSQVGWEEGKAIADQTFTTSAW